MNLQATKLRCPPGIPESLLRARSVIASPLRLSRRLFKSAVIITEQHVLVAVLLFYKAEVAGAGLGDLWFFQLVHRDRCGSVFVYKISVKRKPAVSIIIRCSFFDSPDQCPQ